MSGSQKAMLKTTYLANPDVDHFCKWLAQLLAGQPIHFSIPTPHPGYSYPNLHSAHAAYSWPPRKWTGLPTPHGTLPHIHPAVPSLNAHSPLSHNTAVLAIAQAALRTAYAIATPGSKHLSGAVAQIFHWGGVYTSTGNKLWLTTNQPNLLSILQRFVIDHALGDDNSTVPRLRFNSGMTKVYSLLIDDFIMYDNRVSASMAWLALDWWTKHLGNSAPSLPPFLRFACPPTNGKMAPHRNPNQSVFPTLSGTQPYAHYTWNVRTNWLLAHALLLANQPPKIGHLSPFKSLRDVEAALFQMGYCVI